MYRKIGTMLLSHPGVHRVADVAAGKSWGFPKEFKEWYGLKLIGLDIDRAEMDDNDALDEKIVCDAVEKIPLEPGSLDMVSVHSGVEHFSDTERFLANTYAALRPGGVALLQFPGRYAPFAIVNRLVPRAMTRRLLDLTVGDTEELGFLAYYDRTNYSAFMSISRRVGFETMYYFPGYFSSYYSEFFLPLFIVHYAYDIARFAAGIRNIASYNLWVLRKPGDQEADISLPLYAWPWSRYGWGSE
jgi:SAM-dependent methyltransferase